MYTTVTGVNDTVLYIWKLLRKYIFQVLIIKKLSWKEAFKELIIENNPSVF